MKFYCDSCNTKYAISDDKVRGKVLKVRCKHCQNIITVRELEAVAVPPQPPAQTTETPQTNWHFSINGVSTGPMGLATLKSKYAAGEIGDETYVWHDTFDGWKPVATVAIFAEALRSGFARKPRFETHAYTGISEAVQAEPSQQREGVAPKKIVKPAAKPELPKPEKPELPKMEKPALPKIEKPTFPKGAKKDEPKVNEARLDKLREKLSTSSLKKPDMKPLSLGDPKPKLDALKVEKPGLPAFTPEPDLSLPPFKPEPGLAFSPTLPDSGPSFPGQPDPIADTMLPDDINSGFAPMDDISDELPNFGDAKPRDLFDPGADTYGLDADSDSMPFFPEDIKPSLGGDDAPSEVFASSKSLLIELDKIKKTDRKKSIIFLLGGLFVLLLLAGVGTYMYLNREIEEVAVVEKVEEREAKILSYSKGQIEAGFVQLEDMVIEKGEIEEPEDEKTDPAEADPAKKKTVAKVKNEPKKIATLTKKTETKTEKKSDLTPEEELRRKLLATGSAPIKRPEDMIGTSSAVKAGLSRVQAQAGFKKVSRSVSTCRQRHASRSGKELESAKVKISVEVLPTGKVSTFRISPGTLRHTAFDSCMKSKKETWRFAKFGGKPVKINRTFILQ